MAERESKKDRENSQEIQGLIQQQPLRLSQHPGVLVEVYPGKIRLSLAPSFQCKFFDVPNEREYLEWLRAYASGKHLPFPFDLSKLPPFTAKALKELEKIPCGKTASYRDIATRLKKTKASRAVGNACRSNPFPLIIPCHRVIGSNSLGGYTPGLELKKRLLSFEKAI